MDLGHFWTLIDETRPATRNVNHHALAIIARLVTLEPEEIVSFERHILSLMAELDCVSVRAVACLVLGLPSDDQLTYFYGWTILQGREVVEDLLHRPGSVGGHFPQGVVPQCEAVGAIAMRAYQQKTGHWQLPIKDQIPERVKDEVALNDEQIQTLFPDLWQRFVIEQGS